MNLVVCWIMMVIALNGNMILHLRLVKVGADGINSLVRKRMNIEPFTINYNQMGLVATVELSDSGDNSVAWQRFLPTGPVALLPLNDTTSSLVWTHTPAQAKELQSMPPQEFVDALNDAFYKDYPKDTMTTNLMDTLSTFCSAKTIRQYPPAIVAVKDKSRACFPLGFGHAPSYVAQGAALVGDAAHRVHPLAGQGVNLGFGDVKCLTQVLADAVYSGYPIGDKNALLKYERERLMKNVPIMFGIHGLQQLYSTTFSPVVMLRSLGLQITQNLPPLKKIFMQQAMG
ncbi:unnamed protein product [Hermetia illucens]|uniref:FAD-binding domain-containing protein n=1 Tax=Hermetia illucens TaxID=343691 RepID=A0A7R8UNK8_HERIL|nr:unnamed protein product [Hermetia illucens]